MRGKLFVGLIAAVLLGPLALGALPQPLKPSDESRYTTAPGGGLGMVLDVDGDGLPDADEADMRLDYQNPDSDGDGIRDGEEFQYWSNLSLANQNRTVPSWVRARHPGMPAPLLAAQWGPGGDLDGDGRPNINDTDSDSDGIIDGRELNFTLSPANPDSDDDGVVDGLDPRPAVNLDADTDGMADDWESWRGVSDAAADSDMDGVMNMDEFRQGTDPNSQFRPSDRALWFSAASLRVGGFQDFYGTDAVTSALFQVTPITNPRYWRLQTYQTFNGWLWTSPADTYTLYKGAPQGRSATASELWNNVETYRVVVNGTLTGKLPTALHTGAVTFAEPRGARVENGSFGDFRTADRVTAYNFTAALYRYDNLTGARPDPSETMYGASHYATGSRVSTLALNVTAGKNTTLERLKAIALYLGANYRFDRSAGPPAADDALEYFLFTAKAGISVQFATAFVEFARVNGIPARLVVGYVPGVIKGDSRYIQVGHRHAWAEVALDGYGWVGVEATPPNAEPDHGLGLGSSGIDINVLQFWSSGVSDWWYLGGQPGLLGGDGGGTAHGGYAMVVGLGGPRDDPDGDGLNNTEEATAGTNPYSTDTDQDGLNDTFEVRSGFNPRMNDADGDGLSDEDEVNIYHTNPNRRDTDGGGTCDHQEVDRRTNPLDPKDDITWRDFDNDRIADWDEVARGTDPRGTDMDMDGITDVQEVAEGTDPAKGDSDGDSLYDIYEKEIGTNPASTDSDSDGLDDSLELKEHLNPLAPDTDGDGISDGTEYLDHSLNPHVYDQDRDGLSDGQEVRRGTDPINPDSGRDRTADTRDALVNGPGTNTDTPAPAPFPWTVLVGLLLALVLASAYGLWRRKHMEEMEKTLKRAERRIMELDIDSEPDEVRRVIYRTYRSLCSTLKRYGFLKEKGWTLREFERAVGEALCIDAGRLSELTGIVEEARYSDHRLSPDYRDRALACIRGILDSLGTGRGARAGRLAAA